MTADASSAPPAPLTTLARLRARLGPPQSYFLTRFVLLRLLGVVYLVAFAVLVVQGRALIGHDGLLPADAFLARVGERAGSGWAAFWRLPTLLWIDASDATFAAVGWIGVAVSLAVVAGFANAVMLFVLWALYLSVSHAGQLFYGYGWELQLSETGFLAMFLVPLVDARPFPRRPPPAIAVWLFRWLIFRLMLGAGLIKLRGDPCWRALTCLDFHYETQPIPNPLSRLFHFAPTWTHRAGVLFNHLAELVAPWLGLGPRRLRHVAGVILVAFQLLLIASGNLSFLNWLTIVPALACFDDTFWRRILPRRLCAAAARAEAEARPSRAGTWAAAALAALVGVLSIPVVANLLSGEQHMNESFNRFDLVNTYGAFGSVGKERYEIVLEGTDAGAPERDARWREYEWKCKPGDPARRPCWISPYHLRLDWQVWFAAMGTPEDAPWMIHLVWKLLHNDPGALGLLDGNPFPDGPPRFIRARLYRYRMAPAGSGVWWTRADAGEWLPPVSVDDPGLTLFLRAYGWRD
jgi:hypothetical protein